VQRIKDAKPEAVFMFVPAGEQSIAFMKAFEERGLGKDGVKLIATGDLTDDDVLQTMGAPALGVITSHHYSASHDSPENRAFVKAFKEVNKDLPRPNFMGVGGYDGMGAIVAVVKQLGNKIDPDKAMEILKNYKALSPRGPISIDRPRATSSRRSTSARSRSGAASTGTSSSTRVGGRTRQSSSFRERLRMNRSCRSRRPPGF
jgi:branched-chain amino acid transport system substrate-binding protein